MILRICALSLVLVCISCQPKMVATPISEGTYSVVSAMESDTFIGTETIGRGGGPSDAYKRRTALMNTANQIELLSLLDHKNPVVALSAFEGLCRKGYVTAPSLLSVFEKKYVPVHVIIGDVSHTMSTLAYAWGYVLGMPIPSDENVRVPVRKYEIDQETQMRVSNRISVFQNSQLE